MAIYCSIKLLGVLLILSFITVNGLAIKWKATDRKKDLIIANDKSFAQTESLQSEIIDFLTRHHYTGCTVGVASADGTVIYTQGYGTTKEGAKLKSTTELPVSSISKQLTAIGIMKLVEEGHLTLSDFVFGKGGILGDLEPFPSSQVADQRLFDVRVIHLLHHTSGIQSYISELNDVRLLRGHRVLNITQEMGLVGELTLQEVIRYTAGQSFLFTPGSKFSYSNLGYAILGEIIKTKSRSSYSKYIHENVLEPLGMWKTTLIPGRNTYLQEMETLDISNSPLLLASLGWHSTVHDLLRLMDGLQKGKVLSQESLQIMLSPPPSPVSEHQEHWYGMGVRAGNDGSWWQTGDRHTNDVIIYHPGQKTVDQLSWVVLLTSNQHRNLRNDFTKIFRSQKKWPPANYRQVITDYAEIAFTSECGHHYLMNTQVPTANFKAFTTTLLDQIYQPIWINVYHKDNIPQVSSIWRKRSIISKSYLLEAGISGDDLQKVIKSLHPKMFLNSLTPYLEGRHWKYIAVFTNESTGYEKYGWETTEDIYKKSEELYSKELTLFPTVKSVFMQSSRKVISFMFDKINASSWRSYDMVSLVDMKSLVMEMARHDRRLTYANSYYYEGEVYFSTIFADVAYNGMQLELEVDQSALQSGKYSIPGKDYQPEIISSYETDGSTKFLILWTREKCH